MRSQCAFGSADVVLEYESEKRRAKMRKKKTRGLTRVFYKSWHRAIFPGGLPPSIVAADRLYRRVRDGNGCVPVALAPRTF